MENTIKINIENKEESKIQENIDLLKQKKRQLITNKENWKDISAEFAEELQQEWEEKGFGYEECKEWIDAGLKVSNANFSSWLRDTKLKTSKDISNHESKDKYLKKQLRKYKNGIISAIPLEKLYDIHSFIKDYHGKWDKDKIVELIDSSTTWNEGGAILSLNKIFLAVGSSLYVAGEVNDNKIHKNIGGMITLITAYIEYISKMNGVRLFLKLDPLEKVEKEIGESKVDAEILHSNYQNLREIIKPIHVTSSLGKLGEVIEILRNSICELTKEDSLREADLVRSNWLKLDKDWLRQEEEWLSNCNNFITKSMIKVSRLTFFYNRLDLPLQKSLFRKGRWLNEELYNKWEEKWEKRRNKREEIKSLLEILQEAISEYRQGISDNEIEKKIEIRMLELEEKKTNSHIGEDNEEKEENIQQEIQDDNQLEAQIEQPSKKGCGIM